MLGKVPLAECANNLAQEEAYQDLRDGEEKQKLLPILRS